MMNPASLLKLRGALSQFKSNHPKFVAFFTTALAGGVTEGTILEITMTRPGEEPITTNMRVTESDLELFRSLKDLK